MLHSLVAFLFPHRWRGQLAQARRLLGTDAAPPPDVGERIDRWLRSSAWEVRNAALKLIAHLRDESRYPLLIAKLTDRREVGIVRRNAAEAIARVGLDTAAARTALRTALGDPYWEVRTEAGRALAVLFPPAEQLEQDFLDLLYGHERNGRRAIVEDNFEVRMAVAEGLGHLGVSGEAFEALARLARDESWPVRSQAAVGISHFAARHADFFEPAREILLDIDRQSEGAVSYFVHRDILSRALRAVHRGPGGTQPDEFHGLYLAPKAGWNHVRK
ncbi:HEAT repeat domain-containing protein [Planctomycetota bacterium]